MTIYYMGIDPDLHHAGVAVLGPDEGRVYLAKINNKATGELANVTMAYWMRTVIYRAFREAKEDHDSKHPEETETSLLFSMDIIIESQRIRPMSKVNPQDIVMLAQAAGVALGICATLLPEWFISLVQPQDWKGSIPKESHHAVIREHYGIEEGSLGPHESHLLDAIGLAAWGQLRDLLPRAADRSPDARLSGSVLSKQRLARLPRLKIRVVTT